MEPIEVGVGDASERIWRDLLLLRLPHQLVELVLGFSIDWVQVVLDAGDCAKHGRRG